jgi:hypothetical protein
MLLQLVGPFERIDYTDSVVTCGSIFGLMSEVGSSVSSSTKLNRRLSCFEQWQRLFWLTEATHVVDFEIRASEPGLLQTES